MDVYQSTGNSQAVFHGLNTCGSVWLCPRCSAKITERRRRELNGLVDKFKDQAEYPSLYMLTNTVPHDPWMTLQECIDGVNEARRGFFSSGAWEKIKRRYGWKGHVIVVEMTHSWKNGWHVHLHVLVFVDNERSHFQPEQYREELEAVLYRRWRRFCIRRGFRPPSQAHGLQLQDGTRAMDYVAKYGADHQGWTETSEIAKSHLKKARRGHRSPWQILADVHDHGRHRDVKLWREYAEVMPGRQQLRVSRGFAASLGVEVKADEVVAAELHDSAVWIARLQKQQWAVVIGCATGEAQACEAVEMSGLDGLQALIDRLGRRSGAGDLGRVLRPGELADMPLPVAIVGNVDQVEPDYGVPVRRASWREFGYESLNDFYEQRSALCADRPFKFVRRGGDPPPWWFPSSPHVDPLPVLRFAQAMAVVAWLRSRSGTEVRQIGQAQLAFTIFDRTW